MEFTLPTSAVAGADPADPLSAKPESGFEISAQPVVAGTAKSLDGAAPALPRSYGTESLSLLARDPHTVFAFWDIDWNSAFHDLPAKERKIHLRLLNSEGLVATAIEVEPMAGNCYVTVADADAAYSGEIGYYHPATNWNCLAASALITTPPDEQATETEVDFATVPFHLSFQRMVDLLQATKHENATLTAMLADLRERMTSAEQASLSPEQRELARVVETVRATTHASAATRSPNPRLQQKLERILGFGGSSPSSGFGGSSRGS